MNAFNPAAYHQKRDAKRAAKAYQVKVPSGAIFTLCKPNINLFLASGKLPQSYIEKLMSFERKNGDEIAETYKEFSPAELAADTLFLGLIVRAACVNPKIVDYPKNETELEFSDLDDEDLMFIFRWAVNAEGGAGDAEKAAKFRS